MVYIYAYIRKEISNTQYRKFHLLQNPKSHLRYISVSHISVDGQWSKWSDFTQCTQSCGFGKQHRTRRCDAPSPQHGGKFCVGTDIDLVEGCNPYPCPSKEHILFLFQGLSGITFSPLRLRMMPFCRSENDQKVGLSSRAFSF